ncbi:hypothetical protein Q5752_006538 [Cryptotrichosporon argae]
MGASHLNPSVPHDVQDFLRGYPHQRIVPTASANLEFYSNRLPCRPDNLIYEAWMDRHSRDLAELEYNHGYVQWLFPIRERGVNPSAQPLQPHEISVMAASNEIMARLLRSYKMMLRFYGIDFNDGRLRRTDDWKERFSNLTHAPHNLLRLTRILKHLSEFALLQPHAPVLVAFFAAQHADGRLDFSGDRTHGQSMERWWARCFRDERERDEVERVVKAKGAKGEGRWGEREFGEWVRKREEEGKMGWTG